VSNSAGGFRVEQVIVGPIHQIETHRLQIGGHFRRADESAERAVEVQLVGQRPFHIADRHVSVANQPDRRLQPASANCEAGRRMIKSPTLASVNVPRIVIAMSRSLSRGPDCAPRSRIHMPPTMAKEAPAFPGSME
jgi:hypothetical protein